MADDNRAGSDLAGETSAGAALDSLPLATALPVRLAPARDGRLQCTAQRWS